MADLFETQEGQQESGTPAQAPAQGQEQGNGGDLFADQLAAIKAEDGRQKYADVATALNSIPHAQSRINELSAELNKLKEENAKMKGFEEVLSRLDSKANEGSATTQPEISVDALQDLVEATLTQREKAAKATANEAAVKEGLVAKFGDLDKANEQLKAKAAQLGVDMATMRSLAQASPNAVLSYFEGTKTTDVGQPSGFGTAPVGNESNDPDPFLEARSKLFGQRDALKDKWRNASLN